MLDTRSRKQENDASRLVGNKCVWQVDGILMLHNSLLCFQCLIVRFQSGCIGCAVRRKTPKRLIEQIQGPADASIQPRQRPWGLEIRGNQARQRESCRGLIMMIAAAAA